MQKTKSSVQEFLQRINTTLLIIINFQVSNVRSVSVDTEQTFETFFVVVIKSLMDMQNIDSYLEYPMMKTLRVRYVVKSELKMEPYTMRFNTHLAGLFVDSIQFLNDYVIL